jgi:DNA invertase Pin-like site-specific DNA recombinase
MKAIYTRISTANQNIERQLRNDGKLFIDVCSGSVPFANRKGAIDLMNDESITSIQTASVDRLGRNLKDILTTLEYFNNKLMDIYIEDIGLHTIVDKKVNPIAQMIISMLGCVAEMEKANIKERTKQGIEIAKTKGKFKGKKRGSETTDATYLKRFSKQIYIAQKLSNEGKSINAICNELNDEQGYNTPINRATLTKLFNRGLILKTTKTENAKKLLKYLNQQKDANKL